MSLWAGKNNLFLKYFLYFEKKYTSLSLLGIIKFILLFFTIFIFCDKYFFSSSTFETIKFFLEILLDLLKIVSS